MAEDSSATDVGARYAQALFDLAVETNGLPAVEADLKAVTAMLAASAPESPRDLPAAAKRAPRRRPSFRRPVLFVNCKSAHRIYGD